MRYIFAFLNVLCFVNKCVNLDLDENLDFHVVNSSNHVFTNFTNNTISTIINENDVIDTIININVHNNNRSKEISVMDSKQFLSILFHLPDGIYLLDHKLVFNKFTTAGNNNKQNINEILRRKSTLVNNYTNFGMRINKPYFMSTSVLSKSLPFIHQNHSHEVNLRCFEKLITHKSKKANHQLSEELDCYNYKILNKIISQDCLQKYNHDNNLRLFKRNIDINIHNDKDSQIKNSTKNPYLFNFSDSTPQVYHISYADGLRNIKQNLNNSFLNFEEKTSIMSSNPQKYHNKNIRKTLNQKEMNINKKLRTNSRIQEFSNSFKEHDDCKKETKPSLSSIRGNRVNFKENIDLYNWLDVRTNVHSDHLKSKNEKRKLHSREFFLQKATNQPLKKIEYNNDNNKQRNNDKRKVKKIFKKNLQDNEENEASHFSYEWRGYPFQFN